MYATWETLSLLTQDAEITTHIHPGCSNCRQNNLKTFNATASSVIHHDSSSIRHSTSVQQFTSDSSTVTNPVNAAVSTFERARSSPFRDVRPRIPTVPGQEKAETWIPQTVKDKERQEDAQEQDAQRSQIPQSLIHERRRGGNGISTNFALTIFNSSPGAA